ncbi:3-deoxy-7-phosphoheptulonate synthase [Microbispora sp. NPDC049633]|uniref:3-deoxy-7-phosphoheptulonate synthase n=1 Tax=Microbispora sp. NPDC049633 TaxID=3154355 RepID=UPI00342A452B
MTRPSQLVEDVADLCEALPALHQPEWEDVSNVERVRDELERLPALVEPGDVIALKDLLAEAAGGNVQVVQAGDCAEDPAECTPVYVARKAALLDALAGAMKMNSRKPVVRVGRIAGQFAKPRSQPTERHGDVDLPVYRGHMVNGPEPDPELRRPDPERLLTCYRAASDAMDILRRVHAAARAEAPVWTSHEALLLDYEIPLLRYDDEGRPLLTSTHWPWVGERTRQVGGAHVALLAGIVNPVACKVGPAMTPGELVALCARLDPEREPGRLTLISRMGADRVGILLPPLVAAVREAGHPVIWLCDPMHGNTIRTPEGLKTRLVETVIRETLGFQEAVAEGGGVAAGLHLETSPEAVTECADDEDAIGGVGDKYTSLCDPRLNPRQAITVASAWRG